MTKPDILQVGAYPNWDQEALDAAFTMHKYFEANDKQAFLAEVGPKVTGIATRGDLGADKTMLDACPNLEIVSLFGVGYDAVDIDACAARGIHVTNTPDVLTKDVADLAVAMMLTQTRDMVGASTFVRDGTWAKEGMFPLQSRVWGRKAGILGLGRIGYETAKRLAAFDLDIAYSSTGPKDTPDGWTFIKDPVELATKVDFLFVTLAASAETKHIVNKEVLDALGPEGMVINVSRAANIDENALLDALEAKTIAGAALDVFEGEPVIDRRFFALDNVLLQPHHGSGTFETRKAMGALVRENLIAHFAGQPLLTKVV